MNVIKQKIENTCIHYLHNSLDFRCTMLSKDLKDYAESSFLLNISVLKQQSYGYYLLNFIHTGNMASK